MARGVNKVILLGNVGGNPEVRYLPNGNAVTNITLATSENWKDKQTGQKQERTEWHRVVFFGRLAEIAGEYLRKGSQVYIEGSLRTRKWQGQDGQDRYATEVVVDVNGSLQLLGSRPEGPDRQPATAREAAPVASNPVTGSASKASKEEKAVSYEKAKGKSPKKEKRVACETPFVGPKTAELHDSLDDDIPF